MTLTRLIYASTITPQCDTKMLETILSQSRKNNGEAYLTGLLSFSDKYFLQCLEGSRSQVNHTYNRILNDPRHTNVIIISFEEISSRDFGDWSMGNVPSSALTSLLNLQFSASNTFNPYELSAKSAYLMLIELKKNLPSK